MIGIIQNVLMDLLVSTGGESLKQSVLQHAGLPPDMHFRIDQNYSDIDCLKLIDAAAVETGLSVNEVYALYATAFINQARDLFPRFFEISKTSEEFLMRQATVHAVMASGLQHSEDRKQVTDKFSATQLSPGLVRIDYRSPNLLCGLFKALVHEVSSIYNETVSISCARCVKEGQSECSFNLQWPQSKSVQHQHVKIKVISPDD